MDMTTEQDDGRLVITVAGDLDADVAYQPYEEMVARTDDVAVETVVLDVGAVTFADSVAVGMLVRMNDHARDINAEFQVRDTPPTLRRLLDLTGISNDLDLT